jgi:hypothetical protein
MSIQTSLSLLTDKYLQFNLTYLLFIGVLPKFTCLNKLLIHFVKLKNEQFKNMKNFIIISITIITIIVLYQVK